MHLLLRLLSASLLLVPAVGQAQVQPDSDGYLIGSYTLGADGSRHEAMLKLRNPQLLTVRNPDGKNLKLTANDVAKFDLGGRRYFTLTGIALPGQPKLEADAAGNTGAKPVFVQQVDSGQVVLVQYNYGQSLLSPASIAVSQVAPFTKAQATLYLLRRADSPDFTLVQGSNKHFRELMRPYLASRPDLLKYLEENRLADFMLPGLIHSLNTGVSYLPPERYPGAKQ